ncbi:MAG TPA: hypothetical protein VK501_27300 [Baekduia sp.]|uniref:hypothetical protein n=1 Tax=Baekduia sp. TaxID=2600305 RepID=UPI002B76AE0B|nr:hypothetical protein [Baekduia sp.]HMJ37643.1 hypothetical protein [Baekduia sp.]
MTTDAAAQDRTPVPRDRADDYTRDAARLRREFLEQQTGASLNHVAQYSLDPATLPGNIEHFTGVAQLPIGIAGPAIVAEEWVTAHDAYGRNRP